MLIRSALATVLLFGLALPGMTQEKPESKPVELEVLKSYVGVWDAEIEVWPEGPDLPSIKFKGVETNRLYGEYWIASDFDSEYMDETMRVHSIVGYDLDRKKMVGTIIDHGPYAATMTGGYEVKSKTVRWEIKAKDVDGTPIVQQVLSTQENANQRLMVLMVPGEKKNEFKKFMQIRFVKRQ